ncbi:MAG: glucuronate isomerase [Halanaerobiales bacterium]
MAFLDDDYLLESEEASNLYEQIKDLPIVDAHNHGDVKEIVENEGWNDIWEVEGETDHYVWELMRRRGVSEEKITGDAPNKEKWRALAEIFPEIAGNPTYEWIHLDLKRRFGIDKTISEHTADVIWDKTKAMLDKKEMSPQNLLKEMNVKIMCTTDDPDSLLTYHKKAAEEVDGIKILPTWRPDKAMNIDKDVWKEMVTNLGENFEVDTEDFAGFMEAMQKSHDYFDEMGCVASDHGIREPKAYPVAEERIEKIYKKAINDEELDEQEIEDFKAFMLLQFGKMNEESGWVTQIHIGAVRDYRDELYEDLGADAGGDIAINNINVVDNLKFFFNEFDGNMEIVLYYLDPELEPSLTTIARAFPNVSMGAPWWFNDSPYGMEKHLKYVSTVDLLSNHAGMVSDSRKLMSYDSRNEVFRRVLSNVLGDMVKKGQMPYNCAADIASSLSYYRPLKLFFE